MTLYLLQRLLYLVPLLLGAVTIVFVLVHMAPGNPVDYIIGESGADKEMIARLTADMGWTARSTSSSCAISDKSRRAISDTRSCRTCRFSS